MNRISDKVAAVLRASEEPVPSIGKAPGATKLGLFELTMGEVQQLASVLEEARKLVQTQPESLRAVKFLEALDELARLIADYRTQYVEVWVSDFDDWRDCPGRAFAHVFPPREFAR